MSNLKQTFLILIFSIIGGIATFVFIFPLLLRVNFLNTAVVLDKILNKTTITQVQKETIIVPQSNYFSEAIKKAELTIVAVQSFSGGQLMRSGSGIILTQDGLIATINSVVPSGAQVFQVSGGDKIYKAKVVFRDYAKNIAVISVPETNFQVANFKSDLPDLGQKMIIFSKLINFGRESSFVEEALISSVDENNSEFETSAPYDWRLYGAALVDTDGTILGIVDFKNQKPVIIFSNLIKDVLNTYLTRLTVPKP